MITRGAKLALALLFLIITQSTFGQPVQPVEKRVALVIGIGAYQNAPALTNPTNDARAMSETFRRLNFEVVELYDGDYRRFSRALREFGIKAAASDVAVVYFAGHGVQVGRENYLLPADARLERERDLLYETIPLELMLGEVSQARKLGIVLLDSCRNNPFVDRLSRSVAVASRGAAGPGLARVDNVPRNTLVAMATKADQTAEDGDGNNSPFAEALLTHLQMPGLELSLFFRSVRDAVLRATNNRQEPFVFSSLGAEPFYFYPRPPNRNPQISVLPLEVRDNAGPTPLLIPSIADPDQDPLTARIIGLPRSGEVRIEGRVVTPGAVFPADRLRSATYKPAGSELGGVGTIDVLVEDNRGGSALGSVIISVVASNQPPTVEPPRRLRIYTGALGITPPTDPDGDQLWITVRDLPRGLIRSGTAPLRSGERVRSEQLANLIYIPEPGFTGNAGSLRYTVEDGRGGRTEGAIEFDVIDPLEAATQMAEAGLWERLRASGRLEDVEMFIRLYPNSYLAAAAQRERVRLLGQQPNRVPMDVSSLAEATPILRPGTPGIVPQPTGRVASADIQSPAAAVPALRPGASRIVPQPTERSSDAPGPVASLPQATPVPMPVRRTQPPDANVQYFQDCRNCPQMVRIPGGSFMMGQGAQDPSALPVRRVTIEEFSLGRFPVTVAEWNACRAGGGCGPLPRMVAAQDTTPLHNVSWDDAASYVDWLSRTTGHLYRLPTEAEWEYAARAGTLTRYWWGDQPGVGLANCSNCGGNQNARTPLPLESFQPNGFGLYGMLGSVAEWVQDCWFPNYNSMPADGSAREARNCTKRVLRGGSFRTTHEHILSVSRGSYDAPVRYLANGFRVARSAN
jgi:formylglycine-generating enzyme required for sulfatase activity